MCVNGINLDYFLQSSKALKWQWSNPGTPDGTFFKSLGFVSFINLVKSPQKVGGKPWKVIWELSVYHIKEPETTSSTEKSLKTEKLFFLLLFFECKNTPSSDKTASIATSALILRFLPPSLKGFYRELFLCRIEGLRMVCVMLSYRLWSPLRWTWFVVLGYKNKSDVIWFDLIWISLAAAVVYSL